MFANIDVETTERIRRDISDIVQHINKFPSAAEETIADIIDKVWEDAYQEGFKDAEEKFNTKETEKLSSVDEENKTMDKADRIKKELEYINNPNMYIDIYNSYRDKSIAYPLAEYLDIRASQSGFDDYEDMLNEGFSIDYSGAYIKEPEKNIKNDKNWNNIER